MSQSRRPLLLGCVLAVAAVGAVIMFVNQAVDHKGVIRHEDLKSDAPDAPLERGPLTPEPLTPSPSPPWGEGSVRIGSKNARPDDEQPPAKAVATEFVPHSSTASRAETDTEQWKTLIGQPAPEFSPQGWLFGEATSLEKLRGRWVVLYFWDDAGSPFDLTAWIVFQSRFGDQGPVVIIVKQPDTESIDEEQAYFETISSGSLEGRPFPFRVLVDRREPNVIPGTTIPTGGATRSAYRVARERTGNRTTPIALLIGPDGTVRQQIASQPNRSSVRDLEIVTGLKAGKPQWEKELLREYSLPAGTVLRRFPPPYSEARDDYCRFDQGSSAATLTFIQGDKLRPSGSTLGTEGTLQFVLHSVIGFRSYEWFDPDDLPTRKFTTGDWSSRADTPREELLRELERILKTQLEWNERFERMTVKREVVVVSGDWQQAPLTGAQNKSWIYFTVDDVPAPNVGGGSSGSFDAMLAWLADSVGMKFVHNVAAPPTGSLTWRDQLANHKYAIRHATPAGDEALTRVLENLARQTGLSLQSEERDVDVWRIVEE